jgi:hypothetical protein
MLAGNLQPALLYQPSASSIYAAKTSTNKLSIAKRVVRVRIYNLF